MAVTVEELEIVVRANIKDALAGMTQLKTQLRNILSAQLPNISAQLAPVKQIVDQYGSTITASAAKTQSAVKQTGDKVKQTVQSTQQAVESVKKTLSAVADPLKNINMQIDVQKQKMAQLQSKYESVASSKGTDSTPALNLQNQILKTGQTIDRLTAKASKMGESLTTPLDGVKAKVKEAADEFSYLDGVIQKMYARQKQESGGVSLPTSAPRIPSATATQMDAQKSAASVNNAPMVDQSQLSGWQRFTAQYRTYLDNAKAALNKFGLYGKESVGQVKNYTDAATTATKKYGNQVRDTTSKSNSSFGSLGQTIKRVLVSAVIYQGFRKLFDFIKSGLQSAIDAPEIENLFRVALGNMSNQAAAFADKLKTSLGIDQYATKQMMGTFQNLSTSMGIGQKTAYNMSQSLTMLANDMASLYNVDPEQASENLQSALTGQGRAVRKYGMVITESTIKQTAWKYGLAQTGAELTEQQKVIARYLTLVDQSKNAQGDMARTIGSVQNQLRILKQNVTAAGRSIGGAFIPFIQAAVPWLNAFFVVIQRVGVALSRWTYSLFGKNYDEEMKKQQAIITGYNGVADSEDAAGTAAADAAKKAKGTLADFDEIKVIQQPDSSSNSANGAGSGGLDFAVPTLDVSKTTSPIEAMADKIQAAFGKIKKSAQPTIDAFNRFTKSLEPVENFAAKAFEDFYNDYLEPLGEWVLGKGLPDFLDTLTRFNKDVDWKTLNKALDDLWKALEPFTENVGEGLNWFLKNVWEPIAAYGYNIVFPKALEVLATAIDILNQAIEKAKPSFQWFYDNVLVPIGKWGGQTVSDDLDLISDSLKILDDLLKGDFPAASEGGQKALNDLGKVIKDFTGIDIPGAVQSVKDGISEFGSWWNEHIGKWWNEDVSPWFTKEKWDGLYSTVKQSLSDKWDEAVTWWNSSGPVKWWSTNVSPWFTKEKWTALYGNVKQSLIDKWGETVTWWNNTAVSKWWNNDVSPWFTAKKWTGMMSGVVDGFKETFKNAVNAGIELFNKFIDWVNSKMKFSWGDIVVGGQKLAGGGSIQLFTIPPITPLATGGVLKQSTLVNVAEYAGAATNPEIVTPQAIMSETFNASLATFIVPLINAIEEKTDAIIDSMRNSGLSVDVDWMKVERIQRPYRNDENSRVGGTIFEI